MVEKTVSVRRRSKNKVWFNEDHGKFKLRSLTGSSLRQWQTAVGSELESCHFFFLSPRTMILKKTLQHVRPSEHCKLS